MNRKEAIRVLEFDLDHTHNDESKEALRMAIKALEQQTCEDAISRQAVIDTIAEFLYYPNDWNGMRAGYDLSDWEWKIKGVLSDVPSVNPQPKTGYWTKMVEVYDLQQNRMLVPYCYDDAKFGNTPVYVCDCGCESNKNSRFCPDCGVKMEVSE